MFKTRPDGKFYPAKVVELIDNIVNLEWHPGNIYARNDKPKKTTFTKTPSECMAACGPVAAARRYSKVCQFIYP
jgi:hypothetical protein